MIGFLPIFPDMQPLFSCLPWIDENNFIFVAPPQPKMSALFLPILVFHSFLLARFTRSTPNNEFKISYPSD